MDWLTEKEIMGQKYTTGTNKLDDRSSHTLMSLLLSTVSALHILQGCPFV